MSLRKSGILRMNKKNTLEMLKYYFLNSFLAKEIFSNVQLQFFQQWV